MLVLPLINSYSYSYTAPRSALHRESQRVTAAGSREWQRRPRLSAPSSSPPFACRKVASNSASLCAVQEKCQHQSIITRPTSHIPPETHPAAQAAARRGAGTGFAKRQVRSTLRAWQRPSHAPLPCCLNKIRFQFILNKS
jgi:hypothetical protein